MTVPGGRGLRPFVHETPVLEERFVRVLFGAGSFGEAVPEIRALGTRPLLIAGPHEDGPAERVTVPLGDDFAGRVREVTQHVSREVAGRTAARVRESAADVLLAVGGGSSTGIAKAVALETGLRIMAGPTTYAGSEMTPIWGLTDERGKATGRAAQVLPRTVIYDPELTVSLPAGLTAASGMNALAHALEALYARTAREPSWERAVRFGHIGATDAEPHMQSTYIAARACDTRLLERALVDSLNEVAGGHFSVADNVRA